MESAFGVLNFGDSYLKAARHLLADQLSGRLGLPFDDPISFLFGHGIELTLKACLLHQTNTHPQTHDLERLIAEARAAGCSLQLDVTEEGHFRLLNVFFGKSPHENRYLRTGHKTVHDDQIINKISQRFGTEAKSIICPIVP